MRLVLALIFSIIALNSYSQEKPEGLFIYSKAPDFKGKDQNGKEISLKDLRKKNPVVLVFYCGFWCPYCIRNLKSFEDSLELIKTKGAELIAITPEKKEGIAKTIAKTGAGFSIIPDEEIKIMKAYDVANYVNEKDVSRYKMANIDLAVNNGQKPDNIYLPVQAIYIIDKEGEIKYRFFETDNKKKPSIKDILANLTGLK
jgi:peroxiredoxin